MSVRAEVEHIAQGDGVLILKVRLLSGEAQPGMCLSTSEGTTVCIVSLGFIPSEAWTQGVRLVTVRIREGAGVRIGDFLEERA